MAEQTAQQKKGAHGVVTTMILDSKRVAVKESPMSEEGLSEAKIVQFLQGHPSIIRVHRIEMIQEEGLIRTFMDFIPMTLLDLTKSSPTGLPLERVFRLFLQIVEGVQYIHQKGVCHKDLKLENLMVDDADRITIIDFGFSKYYSPDSCITDNKGSLHYAAPELWHRRPYMGPEVDVWAMGVVLFLLATGHFPFGGTTAQEIYHDIDLQDLWLPPSLLRECILVDLLKQMFDHDMAKRITIQGILAHPWVVSQRRSLAQELRSASGRSAALPSTAPVKRRSLTTKPVYHLKLELLQDPVFSGMYSGDLTPGRKPHPITPETPRTAAEQSPRISFKTPEVCSSSSSSSSNSPAQSKKKRISHSVFKKGRHFRFLGL